MRRTRYIRPVARAVLCLSAALSCGSLMQAALVIEPVFNRVAGNGPAANNFPIDDPGFLIDGVAYFTANEPGEVVSYAAGDPRDAFLDVNHVWNNTQYNITGFTLRIVGSAPVTDNPGTIVRGPVDAVWGDVNGDGEIGLSDIFATITVSSDGKEIRVENGLIPVGGRFTDVHFGVSDNPPFYAAIDSTFNGELVPEPHTILLTGGGLMLFLFQRVRRRRA